MDSLNDAAGALAAFERAEQADRIWAEIEPGLRSRYPDQFVAVRNREVVASDPDLLGLLAKLEALSLAPHDVMVRFLRTDWDRLIL